jgi:hypothetical protein
LEKEKRDAVLLVDVDGDVGGDDDAAPVGGGDAEDEGGGGGGDDVLDGGMMPGEGTRGRVLEGTLEGGMRTHARV